MARPPSERRGPQQRDRQDEQLVGRRGHHAVSRRRAARSSARAGLPRARPRRRALSNRCRRRGCADSGISGPAYTGSTVECVWMNCLTRRSSSEWKLMTARRPPTASSSSGLQRATHLPELVVHVHAQRLEGLGRRILAGLARAHGAPPVRPARACGPAASAATMSPRCAARSALPLEMRSPRESQARSREPCGNRFAARRVHAHVERAVRKLKPRAGRRAAAKRRRGRTRCRARPARKEPLRARRYRQTARRRAQAALRRENGGGRPRWPPGRGRTRARALRPSAPRMSAV